MGVTLDWMGGAALQRDLGRPRLLLLWLVPSSPPHPGPAASARPWPCLWHRAHLWPVGEVFHVGFLRAHVQCQVYPPKGPPPRPLAPPPQGQLRSSSLRFPCQGAFGKRVAGCILAFVGVHHFGEAPPPHIVFHASKRALCVQPCMHECMHAFVARQKQPWSFWDFRGQRVQTQSMARGENGTWGGGSGQTPPAKRVVREGFFDRDSARCG
jgi:hypothetical protein